MEKGNETALMECRFLDEGYFRKLYDAFTEAFSDYVIPFALTEVQFRNHINLTAVDLERTIGCIEDERIVGFTLNGFGEWEGRSTVYDAGTGVVPDQRRRGVSESMFEMMLPAFRDAGVEQCLLEVITTNTGAINLYEKLGFQKVRRLALLQCDRKITEPNTARPVIEIREIKMPEWDEVLPFWDGTPSWQNSIDAVRRSHMLKQILGAFQNGKCVGYVVFSAKFGKIAQIAVSKEHRRLGIGTALVRAVQNETADGFSMQVINIDTSLSDAMSFFINRGFYERLNQHEMLKTF
ncbi:MAG: GNAT family N-acetyltransferase [Pyrinomonadaceae bacterium]